ncbi:MAG: DUF4097 family beta strand repeat-containing protein [bacterium]
MRKSLTRMLTSGVRPGAAVSALASLLFVLAPTATVLAGSTSYEADDKRTVEVRAETQIYVKNARGKTIIVGRTDTDQVVVRAHKVIRAKDAETAAEWMDELAFSIGTDGEQISGITHHPERSEKGGSFWAFLMGIRHHAYIDYTIEGPADFGAKVSSTSGDVQITSLGGDIKLFGSSGDVFLSHIGGSAFVEISSGDAEVNDVAQNFHIRMSSGDAAVRGVGGTLNVQGTSGDAKVYDVGGDVSIELASGDVTLDGGGADAVLATISGDTHIRGVKGGITATSNSGDISAAINPAGSREFVFKASSGDVEVSFELAADDGFALEVTTSSGSIEGELDIELDQISRRVLSGVVGDGEGRLYIETASGDIRIRQIGR